MQLIWFRKDLRTVDNKALHHANIKSLVENSQSMAIYFVATEQWKRHLIAPIQVDFIEQSLKSLSTQLAQLGIPLLVEQVADFADIPSRLLALQAQHKICDIHANSETEINEIERDKAVLAADLPLTLYQSDCIIEPDALRTLQGGRYKVFSAYRNAWIDKVKQMDLTPLACPNSSNTAIEPAPINIDFDKQSSANWPAGEDEARSRLKRFLDESIIDYKRDRDIPSLDGTSQLSPYLAQGVISNKNCVYQVLQEFPDALHEKDCGAYTWINELVWREFYRHLMIANADLCKGHNYNSLANHINWENNVHHFELWCQGKTGYGLVDAAMRQLNETGWMHNRLRMVTASFLTKHLLIDWRWGEAYFMEHLIDGDLASNNGGWQWAASTGCDAQPYFRIFNPIIQSQKFDPKGLFIRKYVKELIDFDDKSIHFPVNGIVEHKLARLSALDRYSVLKKG
ncbi:MAG: FAD-binding domain-containing protein [Psychromonas sp.]